MPGRRIKRKPMGKPAPPRRDAALPGAARRVIVAGMIVENGTAFDVAVVGGGATGFAAALTAAAAGHATALFAPPARFPPGRTAALMQGSVAILSDLEVWPALEARAAPLTAIRLVDATRRLIRAPETTFYASEIGLPAFGHNIPNGELVETLKRCAERSDGITLVEEPVVSIALQGERASVSTAGSKVTARLVVAADGARSMAREAAGIGVRRWRYPQSALVATFEVQHPHRSVSTEFHTEHGPFTLVPLSGERVSLVWVDRPKVVSAASEASDDALAREVEARAHSIHGAMRLESRPALFPLSAALAERLAAQRTMLVGEAAHLFPPIGAQGLNLGFRDVAALGRVLVRHRADPGSAAALEAYHALRVGDVRTRTLAVDLLNRSLLTDFLPVQAGRAFALSLAEAIPALRRTLMRQGVASPA